MDELSEMDRRRFLTVLGGLGGAMAYGGMLQVPDSFAKEAYPAGKITYIVGYSPGGGNDQTARAAAQFMNKHIKTFSRVPSKVSVIIQNEPGGSGMKAIRSLYTADPDGYTIAHGEDMLHTRSILGKLGFDPFELTYLGRIASGSKVVVTGKNSPIRTWEDVVNLSKKTPIRFGNATFASSNHVGTIFLIDTTGISAKMILFGAGPNTNAALIRGDIHLALNNEDGLKGMIDSGELRPILTFSEKQQYPGCQTIKDIGYPELINPIRSQRYVIAPPKMPANIKKILVDTLKRALTDKEFLAWNEKVGLSFEPIYSPEVDEHVKKVQGFYNSKSALLRKYLDKG